MKNKKILNSIEVESFNGKFHVHAKGIHGTNISGDDILFSSSEGSWTRRATAIRHLKRIKQEYVERNFKILC